MWSTIQLILGVGALLLVWGGEKLSMPILGTLGISFLGLTSMAIGWEGIITRRLVLGRRRSGNRQTYTGLPAVLQGVQFNLMGLFLIGATLMMYLEEHEQFSSRQFFLQFVRRPGLPLLVLGGLLLMQAAITLIGSHEIYQGPRWVVIMNLLISRLLPGGILVILGLGALWLGTVEIMAPDTFDKMGGGFLEVLYGLR
jgi:hypothetical protein